MLLQSVGEQPDPEVLWNLRYQQRSRASSQDLPHAEDGIILFPALSKDLALDDGVLDLVENAWQNITDEAEDAFMRFETRVGMEEEELS